MIEQLVEVVERVKEWLDVVIQSRLSFENWNEYPQFRTKMVCRTWHAVPFGIKWQLVSMLHSNQLHIFLFLLVFH